MNNKKLTIQELCSETKRLFMNNSDHFEKMVRKIRRIFTEIDEDSINNSMNARGIYMGVYYLDWLIVERLKSGIIDPSHKVIMKALYRLYTFNSDNIIEPLGHPYEGRYWHSISEVNAAILDLQRELIEDFDLSVPPEDCDEKKWIYITFRLIVKRILHAASKQKID